MIRKIELIDTLFLNGFDGFFFAAELYIGVFEYFDDVADFDHFFDQGAFAHGDVFNGCLINRQFIVENENLFLVLVDVFNIQIQIP